MGSLAGGHAASWQSQALLRWEASETPAASDCLRPSGSKGEDAPQVYP